MKTKTKVILILIETLLVFFLGFAAGMKFEKIGFRISQKLLPVLVVIVIILIVVIFLYLWLKGKAEDKKAAKLEGETAAGEK